MNIEYMEIERAFYRKGKRLKNMTTKVYVKLVDGEPEEIVWDHQFRNVSFFGIERLKSLHQGDVVKSTVTKDNEFIYKGRTIREKTYNKQRMIAQAGVINNEGS